MSEPYLRKVFPARLLIGGEPAWTGVAAFIYPARVDVYCDTGGSIARATRVVVDRWTSSDGRLGTHGRTPEGLDVAVVPVEGCKCGPLRHYEPSLPAMVGT